MKWTPMRDEDFFLHPVSVYEQEKWIGYGETKFQTLLNRVEQLQIPATQCRMSSHSNENTSVRDLHGHTEAQHEQEMIKQFESWDLEIASDSSSSNNSAGANNSHQHHGEKVLKNVDQNGIWYGMSPEHPNAIIATSTLKIHATLEEVAKFFISGCSVINNTKKETLHQASAATLNAKESRNLYQFLMPKENVPERKNKYIGMRWAVFEPPTGLMKPRDYCFLEVLNDFTDKDGTRGWARAVHSIEHDTCPSFSDSYGYVRGTIYNSGYIFKESKTPGVLDVIMIEECDLKGSLPRWVLTRSLKRLHHLGEMLNDFFSFHRNSSSGENILNNVSSYNSSRKTCKVCNLTFKRFQHVKKCKHCGQYLCKDCSYVWYSGSSPENSKKIRLCSYCLSDAVSGNDVIPIGASFKDWVKSELSLDENNALHQLNQSCTPILEEETRSYRSNASSASSSAQTHST